MFGETILFGGTSPSLSYGVIKEIKLQILQSQTLRILIILDMFLFQKKSSDQLLLAAPNL